MPLIALLIVVLSLLPAPSPAQTGPDIAWTRTYPLDSMGSIASMEPTSDGGYVLAGYCRHNPFLVRITAHGDTLWTRAFDERGWESSARIARQTPDGGFVLTGRRGREVLLIRANSDGRELWKCTLPSEGFSEGQDVFALADGGFLVVAREVVSLSGGGHAKARVICADSTGSVLWTREYPVDGTSVPKLVPLRDGGYVLAGMLAQEGTDRLAIGLTRISAGGDTLWSHPLPTLQGPAAWIESVARSNDGGWFLLGTDAEGDDGPFSLFMAATDSSGVPLWTKPVVLEEGNLFAASVIPLRDGYLIAGIKNRDPEDESNQIYDNGVYFLRINRAGGTQWTRIYPVGLSVAGVQAASDGSYVLACSGVGWFSVTRTSADPHHER
jgi:hypothetical protein